jgi:hypothetical protein
VARGWESKSVESQIESANLRQGEAKPRLTPEQMDAQRKRDSLAFLEQQLGALGWRG